MRISDILQNNKPDYPIAEHELAILKTCTQFLGESGDQPILKNLSPSYDSFTKVKVRFHGRSNIFIETFNGAFEEKFNISNLHQRAIFANGVRSFTEKQDAEPFYIFPRNGYQFMYSGEVENSNEEYKHTFDDLFEQFGKDGDHVAAIVTDLLRYTYTTQNLDEGIASGAEIILYNIPFYYAVKQSIVGNYDSLLSHIK
jgi:hypothetical protein